MTIFSLLFLYLLGCNQFYSQEHTVNYQEVERLVLDESSNLYYPKLMQRYKNNDQNLTKEEYHYLYYGYIFQKNYNPYEQWDSQTYKDFLNKKSLKKIDYLLLKRLCLKGLKSHPFDLDLIGNMIVIEEELGHSEECIKWISKQKNLIETILSSGTGLSSSTAIHVTHIRHEYVILELLNYEFNGQYKNENQCDFLYIKENKSNLKVLHFNVKSIMQYYKTRHR